MFFLMKFDLVLLTFITRAVIDVLPYCAPPTKNVEFSARKYLASEQISLFYQHLIQ